MQHQSEVDEMISKTNYKNLNISGVPDKNFFLGNFLFPRPSINLEVIKIQFLTDYLLIKSLILKNGSNHLVLLEIKLRNQGDFLDLKELS